MQFRIVILLLIISSFWGCKEEVKPTWSNTHFSGKTMGTTYNVKIKGEVEKAIQSSIDSLLLDINMSVSTYIDSSRISQFNQSPSGIVLKDSSGTDQHFVTNFLTSKEIFESSDQYFDASCMPLVNYWGFGYTEKKAVTKVDSNAVKEMLAFVGMDKFSFEDTRVLFSIYKNNPKSQLDFSAIAKGYAVDKIAELLDDSAFENYMVEIGGEVKTKGVNAQNKSWTLGINKPNPDAAINDFQWIVSPGNNGLASSGNYRNYYEVDGQKYGHTINPKTGFPERSNLLGVSVVHPSCMYADALATACMVMGLEKAEAFIEKIPEAEACLIYATNDTLQSHFTSGFEKFVNK